MNTNQTTFPDNFFTYPVNSNSEANDGKKKTAKAKRPHISRKAVSESTQPFLPGLSRRGRPRSKNPISPSTRAEASRKRRMDAGVKRVELLLEPVVAAELDALTTYFRISRVEIISRLIGKAAKRLSVAEIRTAGERKNRLFR